MKDWITSALLAVLVVIGSMFAVHERAFAAEKRVALVIGNAAYESKLLETTANDAGLIAQTLQAAGFDVTGARDLDEDSLRHAFRDFADKVAGAGPDTVAFVYFAGYGLQLEGENYLVPIGVNIARDADIPTKATRVSDYVKSLAASGLKTGVVVLDAARANPFALSGAPLASGLALQEPGPRMTLAYNAAPGTVAPAEKGPYGAYAHALSEMIREGGLPLAKLFDNVRLRVSETSKGAQIPWNSAGLESSSFVFFERAADAPPPADQSAAPAKPISELGPKDGYAAAIQRDTMQGYEDYVASYPKDPSAKRVRVILAVRREAITWRRSRATNTPNAYWSYLRRYPRGPHVGDAHRRLAELAAAFDPPPSFEMIDYDVPPPPEDEFVYVDRPVVMFDDPDFGFAPPPPPPVYFLPPPPPDYVVLPPPYIVTEAYVLPVPVFVPIPAWQRAPAYIAPPPNNLIFANIHNRVIVDHAANNIVVQNPRGQLLSSTALKAAGVGAAAVAIGAALPAYVAGRAHVAPPRGALGVNPLAPPPAGVNHVLPGAPMGRLPGGASPLAPNKLLPATANPAATLHAPPNATPLPTPLGGRPLKKALHGKAPLGAGAPGAPTTTAPNANPAAKLHMPPNATPLATPLGGQPLNKALRGKPPAGRATFAPGTKLPAAASFGQNKNLAPRAGGAGPHPRARAVGPAVKLHGPTVNAPTVNAPIARRAPSHVVRQAPLIHQQPAMLRPQPVRRVPPPTAVFHRPPPHVIHTPQPAYHAPAAAIHAPAPAFRAPAAVAAPRAAMPAPARHCGVVNGVRICK
jgi:uncharacterized caspase-like protein